MTEDERRRHFAAAFVLLGGTPPPPATYEPTVEGLDAYLQASGVRYFSAAEMTTPNHPDKAAAAGYEVFLPARERWHYGAALALVADRCREAVGGPVHCRNWWRPQEPAPGMPAGTRGYNPRVSAGSPQGDHPACCALDLDYRSEAQCRRAVEVLRRLDRSGLLVMSLGIGKRTTHVGMFSPLGARKWTY